MTRRRTWRLVRIVTLGLVLTAAVAVLDRAGSLLNLEQWTYDSRVRYFQRWFAPPDDGIVHVLIDDESLQSGKLGNWPWPRSNFALLLDEAVHAGVRNVAFDVVLDDERKPDAPTKPAAAESPDGTPAAPPALTPDGQFAASLHAAAAAGVKVMLPVGIAFPPPVEDPLARRAAEVMEQRLDTSPDELAAKLGVDAVLMRRVYYGDALKTAIARVARTAVREPGLTDAAAVVRYMPGLQRDGVRLDTPESLALQQSLRLARTIASVEDRLTRPAGREGDLLPARIAGVPLDAFAREITHTGFVDYLPPADGRVRTIPLAAVADGRLVPHFSLALAAMRLGVDITDAKQVEVAADRLILHPPGGAAIRVPIRQAPAGDPPRPVGALFDVPLRGGSNFQSMYAPRGDAFVSVIELWRVIDGDRNARASLQQMVRIITADLPMIDPNDPAADKPPSPDDAAAVLAAAARTLVAFKAAAPDPSPEGQAQARRMRALALSIDNLPGLQRETDAYRQTLKQKLGGKTMLLGWNVTSQAADHVPTSLHADCPGVVIHGAVVNAILSGELWTHLPPGYATALTIVCGVLTTLAVTLLAPSRALLASGALLAMVGGGASVVLFDRYNIVIGLAGPLAAIVVCWAACTLVVTLRERLDRAQVTKRFRSYVDPALVSYVLDNPERDTLAGETREMTVVFIDVEGFTTLTEKMGEKSIAILRDLMDALVPIIRKHNGFVNKFLGDGVMFFYGAPRHDPDHARHAVQTVLEMQQALGVFNASQAEGVPKLGVRAGISTGPMIVGDAGSADASDYTVLGDAVNLAARLEGANKPLGTAALATARTAELCGDQFLFAPLGRLIVVGKENAVAVCEPMVDLSRAGDDQKACAQTLADIWSHIDGRRVLDAVTAVDQLRAVGGRTKLCELLHTLLHDLPAAPADSPVSIRLSGK